jgi:hypothetical protein
MIKDIFSNTIANVKKVASKIKYKTVDLINDGIDWMIENPEITTVVLVPTAIAAIKSSQSMIVSHRVNKQNDRSDRSWYDRSTGLRWDLKRKMTNNDRMAITRMKAEGRDSIDILTTLNLI